MLGIVGPAVFVGSEGKATSDESRIFDIAGLVTHISMCIMISHKAVQSCRRGTMITESVDSIRKMPWSCVHHILQCNYYLQIGGGCG